MEKIGGSGVDLSREKVVDSCIVLTMTMPLFASPSATRLLSSPCLVHKTSAAFVFRKSVATSRSLFPIVLGALQALLLQLLWFSPLFLLYVPQHQ